MRFISALFFALLLAAPQAYAQAQSSYEVWGDADMGFRISFPDTWKQQGGLPADARIRVLSPTSDGANCTIFAKKDRRFMIYPRDYMAEVVAQEIQWEYWEQAVASYEDLYFYYDNYGALGSGDARYTLVDYIDYSADPGVRKRAQIFATFYGDLHMMAMCVAPLETFDRHVAQFGQIVDSIQMKPQYTPNERGYYRDFLETKEYNHHWHEPIVTFFFPRKTMSAYINCSRTQDTTTCLYKPKPPPIRTR